MPETSAHSEPTPNLDPPTRGYRQRIFIAAIIVIGIVSLLLFLAEVAHVLLLLFIAVLIAVALRKSSHWLHTHTRFSENLALLVVTVALALALILLASLIGPRVANQIDALIEQLPASLNRIESQLQQYRWGQWVLEQIPQDTQLGQVLGLDGSNIFSRITGIFSTTISFLGNLLLLIFTALLFAVEPNTYINGATQLMPPTYRDRSREVLFALGDTLAQWLISRAISMMAIGILTTIGLMVINVQLALSLGLIAGLMAFIPLVGPIIALIPAVLIGFLQSPHTALLVFLLYMIVQGVDNYVLTPIVVKRTIRLAPALIVFSQLVLGVLFGRLGLVLAAPLAAVGMVLTQMVYVHDFLERKNPA